MTRKEQLFALVEEAKKDKTARFFAISMKNIGSGNHHVVCNPMDNDIDKKMEIYNSFNDDLVHKHFEVIIFNKFNSMAEVTLWMRSGQHKELITTK